MYVEYIFFYFIVEFVEYRLAPSKVIEMGGFWQFFEVLVGLVSTSGCSWKWSGNRRIVEFFSIFFRKW